MLRQTRYQLSHYPSPLLAPAVQAGKLRCNTESQLPSSGCALLESKVPLQGCYPVPLSEPACSGALPFIHSFIHSFFPSWYKLFWPSTYELGAVQQDGRNAALGEDPPDVCALYHV